MPIDYKRYPKNWKEIVEQIRKRSGDKCEVCGLENHSTVWAIRLWVKTDGKYQVRSIWFRSKEDAERESYGAIRDSKGIVRPVKVILTTAHLDHDETNHEISIDRLMHLCQMDHLRMDSLEKSRRITEKAMEKWRLKL